MMLNKRYGSLAFALALCVATLPAEARKLDLEMLERGLVHHSSAEGGRFDFAEGPMIYQAESNERFTKGYRPERMSYLSGDLVREIHDVPPHIRGQGMFTAIVSALETKGFERIYLCEREECGESAAWRLYLSPLVGGRSETQYYFAGASGEDSYVALYVNELGGQTRILIDHVLQTSSQSKAAKSYVSQPLFPPGSAQLTAAGSAQLGKLAEHVRSESQNHSILLVGHADKSGGLLRNLLLSAARAQAVRDVLISKYKVEEGKLNTAAHGYASPSASSNAARYRGADRRVEAFSIVDRTEKLDVPVEDGVAMQ